jgi:hypothetical protein
LVIPALRRRPYKTRTLIREFEPAAVGSPETTPLWNVHAGERVIAARYKMLRNAAGATSSTFTLGDGADPDGYLTAVDTEVGTEGTSTGAFFTAAGEGKLYTTNGTIDAVYAIGTPGATAPRVMFSVLIRKETP